jgi:ATP phosphoribosyltransferase regulatory subunit
MALPRLFGGEDVLARASTVAVHDRSRRALDNLAEVIEILRMYGVLEYLTIDLGEIRGLDYHTGLTFEGFVGGLGTPVCGGGRYDSLMGNYGLPAPATGFAFSILPLLAAVERVPGSGQKAGSDFLLFNAADDRIEVLRIAACLRSRGHSAARDIIRRDFDSSLRYARRNGISCMMVIGGERCASDEVYLIRASDGDSIILKRESLLDGSGRIASDWLQGERHG